MIIFNRCKQQLQKNVLFILTVKPHKNVCHIYLYSTYTPKKPYQLDWNAEIRSDITSHRPNDHSQTGHHHQNRHHPHHTINSMWFSKTNTNCSCNKIGTIYSALLLRSIHSTRSSTSESFLISSTEHNHHQESCSRSIRSLSLHSHITISSHKTQPPILCHRHRRHHHRGNSIRGHFLQAFTPLHYLQLHVACSCSPNIYSAYCFVRRFISVPSRSFNHQQHEHVHRVV